jgi:signal transduction histidine kinase
MNSANKSLRLLLVEDSEWDAILLLKQIERAGYTVKFQRVQTALEMQQALAQDFWDLVISDYVMPRFSGLDALSLLKETGQDLPFIIVSGHIGEEIAVASMVAGAHDYVMKDKLARLVPAIERELREAEIRRKRREADKALRESEEKYRQLSQQLRASNEELAQAREHLERRVAERTAELRQANAELHRHINERKRLENELLEIAEKERRRIGIDLHDELGQHLNGLALMMKGLELKLEKRNAPEIADATKIQGIVCACLQQARAVARDLASDVIETDNLSVALKGLAKHVESLFQIACRLDIPKSIPLLPPVTVKQLYKIAQEAITNSIKHAKAREVDISLANTGEHLEMTIRNDGYPFPAKRLENGGMGLRIMQYRASVVNGTVEIKRGLQEKGAIVKCTVALIPESEELKKPGN